MLKEYEIALENQSKETRKLLMEESKKKDIILDQHTKDNQIVNQILNQHTENFKTIINRLNSHQKTKN